MTDILIDSDEDLPELIHLIPDASSILSEEPMDEGRSTPPASQSLLAPAVVQRTDAEASQSEQSMEVQPPEEEPKRKKSSNPILKKLKDASSSVWSSRSLTAPNSPLTSAVSSRSSSPLGSRSPSKIVAKAADFLKAKRRSMGSESSGNKKVRMATEAGSELVPEDEDSVSSASTLVTDLVHSDESQDSNKLL